MLFALSVACIVSQFLGFGSLEDWRFRIIN